MAWFLFGAKMALKNFRVVPGFMILTLLAGCGVTINKRPTALTITTTSLAAGTVGTAYSATLAATGGITPYTWAVSSGSLPAGLTLSTSGTISGTPTAEGSSTFTILVTDSFIPKANTASESFTLTINATKLSITTTSPLPNGTIGTAYSDTLAATGGTTPYSWSLASGSSLPTGLSLNSSGVISGTPTTSGTTSFTVQVTDTSSPVQTATANLSLTISPAKLVITTTSLPSGQVGVVYPGATLGASGGVPPYTWSVSTPPLPPGLTLSAAGDLTGTPTVSSSTSPTFVVTDSESTPQTAQASIPLTISPANSHITASNYSFYFFGNGPNGGVAIDGTFAVSNGTTITGGVYDENASGSAPLLAQSISSGTITTGQGISTMLLNTAGGTAKFVFAMPKSGDDIRLIEFDDTSGTGIRGSGLMQAAPSTPSTTLSASYAYQYTGNDANANNVPATIIGVFLTDGKGNITTGNSDHDLAGTSPGEIAGSTGSYAIASNGRGLLKLKLGVSTYQYSFYQTTSGRFLTISLDPSPMQNGLDAPLVAGTFTRQEQSAMFSLGSLSGVSVLEMNGLVQGTTTADILTGLTNSNGKGQISTSLDEYKGQLLPQQQQSGTYTVDPMTGRVLVTVSGSTAYYMYLIDFHTAYVLKGDESASSGYLESQTASSFADSTFSGDFFGGSVPLTGGAAYNAVGVASPDGAGNISILSDTSSSSGLQTGVTVTGTYSTDSTGRVVVTATDDVPRIFYIVSSGKASYLTGDGGGYLGIFEQ